MTPICTVLLITYNHAKFFEKAIDSVLSQKTRYNFIINIFDDASTDGTALLIKKYQEKYPGKVRAFISEKNVGAQLNIWKAYQSVTTEYVSVLEGDDFWCDEKKLDLQITALQQNPECSFCASQSKIVNINDRYRENEHDSLLVNNEVVLNNSIISIDMILNEYSGYINQLTSRVIRMSLIDLDKIKYKESFLYDNCQFFYLLLKGDMYFINRIMSVYQQTGEGNCSGKHPWIRADHHTRALLDFNRETEFKIADKIYSEIIFYLRYTFGIYESTENAPEIQVNKNNIKKNLLSRCWKSIYTVPMRKLRKKIFN